MLKKLIIFTVCLLMLIGSTILVSADPGGPVIDPLECSFFARLVE